jgi:hypothetical protein
MKGKEGSNMQNKTLKVLLFIVMNYKPTKCTFPKLIF